MSALRSTAPLGVARNTVSAIPGGSDAELQWTVGDTDVRLSVDVKLHSIHGADVPTLQRDRGEGIVVLIAPFISPRAQDELEAAGWSFWDSTGNLLLTATDPVLLVRQRGATKDPHPAPARSTRLQTLKGRASSEVIVALLKAGRAASVRDLARENGLPLGSVSRVISLLRDENLLKPTGGGPIVLSDHTAVARRWAEDYSFARTFKPKRYFSLAGDELALRRIAESGVLYGVTGVESAQNWLGRPVLASREHWLFSENVKALTEAADLVPDPRDGRIVVAEAPFLGREGTRWSEGVNYVTPWRAVGDLLSAGGRLTSTGLELANALRRENSL